MVEDEFLSTAKTFTQHIHHAEYVRLKKLAKSRGAGTLRDIDRATDERTEQGVELRLKKEAAENAGKQKKGLKDDDESSDEDPYMHDPQLAGLMTGEVRTGKNLSGMAKVKSNTRAAAGFSQSPKNVGRVRDMFAENNRTKETPPPSKGKKVFREEAYSTDDEDDDLDAYPRKRLPQPSTKQEARSNNSAGTNDVSKTHCGFFKPFIKSVDDHENDDALSFKRKHKESASADRKPAMPLSNDAGELKRKTSSTTNTGSSHDFIARRRAEKEKKDREEKQQGTGSRRYSDIPLLVLDLSL